MILIAQGICLLFLALWLTTGVRDNLLYPQVNEMFTTEVMGLTRMRSEYPEAYEMIAHRRVISRYRQRLVFRLAVAWELLSVIALWIGVGCLAAAILGAMSADVARAVAMGAALMFTTIWAMFLIVGNHFNYWLCHEGAQNTHYQMTLWGLGTLIFLAL
ncbi:MAG: DUF2165 family protein [Sulfitobacter sp.]|nr:DUF2165 family protein [Sulfitobacter sp.]